MSILATVTTTNTKVRVKTAPLPTNSGLKPIAETVMEIKSSKTREEWRMVDAGRRSSVQCEEGERYKERRGSKDTMRRKSSAAKGDVGDFKKRHESLEGKRDVLITMG
jgi:hypothetical protein